jgi:putative SOS response-associated peptidase YedK
VGALILPEENFAQWLDSKNEDVPELQALLRPY